MVSQNKLSGFKSDDVNGLVLRIVIVAQDCTPIYNQCVPISNVSKTISILGVWCCLPAALSILVLSPSIADLWSDTMYSAFAEPMLLESLLLIQIYIIRLDLFDLKTTMFMIACGY